VSTERPYRDSVLLALRGWCARHILDFPCGSGWLAEESDEGMTIDGIDLFASRPPGYARFARADMNYGIPADFLPSAATDQAVTPAQDGKENRNSRKSNDPSHSKWLGYDAIVSCEAIAYLLNPGIFFQSAHQALAPGGRLILTTPNAGFAASRLVFLLRGFFLGHRAMPGIQKKKEHMPLIAWNYPTLHHFLSLSGFAEISLHPLDERTPKHLSEYLIGWTQSLYCRQAIRQNATCATATSYWLNFCSRQANYGRRLVVSARKG